MMIVFNITFIPEEDYDDTEEWVFEKNEFFRYISKFTRVQQVAFYNFVTESKKSCDEINEAELFNFFNSYNNHRTLFTDCLMNFNIFEDTERYTF